MSTEYVSGPTVAVACSTNLFAEFNPGGQYEGSTLEVSQDNAQILATVIEQANQQTSGHMGHPRSGDHELLINITRNLGSIPGTIDPSESVSIINVGVNRSTSETNGHLGRRMLELLDARERDNRTTLLPSLAALPVIALASLFVNPKIGAEHIRHFRRLNAIKAGSRQNERRMIDAERMARKLPPVAEIH